MKKVTAILLLMVFMVGCSSGKKSEDQMTSVKNDTTNSQADVTTEIATEATTEVASTTEAPPAPLVIDPNSLRAIATEKGMLIGTALSLNYFDQAGYLDKVKNEFNIITMENAMKWASINPSRENFIFSGPDLAVQIAEENEMKMRGHTLVWHQQLPLWLTDKADKWTKEELLGIMDNYIETVAGHFKGKIHSWDVLNEIFEEDGTFRQSMWFKTTGEDYIALALNKAHEMDPDAKLFINDYNVETINAKSDGLYNLVKKLLEENVPIDGVGFQCHFIADQIDYDSFAKNVERFEALGLEVQLTEVDLRIKAPITDEKIAAQGEAYKKLMEISLAHNIRVFIVWGVTDSQSWVPGFFVGYSSPLLFDGKYQPKPAYNGLIDALKE